MAKYRKKPIVIEAFQMTGEHRRSNVDWPEWLNHAWQLKDVEIGAFYPIDGSGTLWIRTLEGNLTVSPDDWIIQGVAGELYPCKPDIFDATYEPVDEDTQQEG